MLQKRRRARRRDGADLPAERLCVGRTAFERGPYCFLDVEVIKIMNAKKMDKLTLFLIPIGVAVNFIGGQIAILLRLPLYLDSIGTIVVGALCGAVPGVIVGVISNVLNSITSPVTLFYAILSVIFAVSAAWCSKKKIFRSLPKTLLSSIWFAFVGGGLGAVLTWIIFSFDFGTITASMFAIPLHEVLGLPKFLAQFVSEFVMDLFDKSASLVIVFLVLKAMPNRFLAKLPLGDIYVKDAE